ncbi:hypothetical protein FIBSPDRAFT_848557 [Athelia psychrophila]|uniref:Uncharacterized protein n=1 Tax=Athelia psychrophila TaxID=1759441 RepID=A0A166UZJ3_9AGAM|nr:hypothetical protein FIBSPDRAFT_848557 [Fibularhizoctonia sp. CBS 109695]
MRRARKCCAGGWPLIPGSCGLSGYTNSRNCGLRPNFRTRVWIPSLPLLLWWSVALSTAGGHRGGNWHRFELLAITA